MNKAGSYLVIVSCATLDEAHSIADTLLAERLCACVTVLKEAESHYLWKGVRERSRENLLFIKTSRNALPLLIERVQSLHSYEVPEVIALKIAAGLPSYLEWIVQETQRHE
ncbi:MAG: divalent-cation tolerance protein CutA [Candidatus Omnitrophica bacterium]|nr:divalent-cation tolerance protein CutA [Candidatus Omnitrophota bacterium]